MMDFGGVGRGVQVLLATTFLVGSGAAAIPAPSSARMTAAIPGEQTFAFDLPAMPLPEALAALSRTTGVAMAINRGEAMQLVGIMGRPVKGTYTPDEALTVLTARTGVQFRRDNFQKFTVIPPLAAAALDANAQETTRLPQINVRRAKPRRAP